MLPHDTTATAARIARQIRARLPRAERLRQACELSDLLRELALARLRARHPEWPEEQLRHALLRRRLASNELPDVLR